MKGANEYAKLFKTGQYGRLYIVSGEHARGRTFRIQVLPEGEIAKSNGEHNLCLNKNAVEVYGIIKGHSGWTEEYGWLHRGRWEKDFLLLVTERKAILVKKADKRKNIADVNTIRERNRINSLLGDY